MIMMTKSLLPLALVGSVGLAMGQSADYSTGFVSLDQFEDGQLQAIAQGFKEEYVQPPKEIDAAESEYASLTPEINPCELPNAQTVADYCLGSVGQLSDWCRVLFETNLIYRYADQNSRFTIFAPTNAAIKTFYELQETPTVSNEDLVKILQYGDIAGAMYHPKQLWCKRKYVTTTTLIEGAVKPAKIKCQYDVRGEPVSFIMGSGNKDTPPRFVDPANPIQLCNAHIYPVTEIMQYKVKGVKLNRKNRNKNKNNAAVEGATEAPVVRD
mmetsp:Transcript_21286/g.44840  ORF Transcript_21286/g.44840 Transcript_21286/m.44840 type:complete len:269 (-) Transcript_21286:222-1028(-)|eukprot:CAMPEP_0168299604 /NCGR_PEP_ID=MMETSP0142_2-20121227/27486_1 /TAXON_ID=44445 /ORGANISM="Pseudo-nitzschia australis, Strain 10249 10 AB" /LENGTH=268 /DNA_ID=CAMNT_0008249337 /DNA_START=72 /DNA_END=878 /DNA_ORIENTATION=-